MSSLLSTVAHAVHADLRQQDVHCPRTHILELLASLLGYRTYAALNSTSFVPTSLVQAEEIVFHKELADSRAEEIGESSIVVEACLRRLIRALEGHGPRVHDGLLAFMVHTQQQPVLGDETVSSVMNSDEWAYGHITWDLPQLVYEESHLWDSREQWSYRASFNIWCEDDDHSCVAGIGILATMTYTKVGRAGLRLVRSEIQTSEPWLQ